MVTPNPAKRDPRYPDHPRATAAAARTYYRQGWDGMGAQEGEPKGERQQQDYLQDEIPSDEPGNEFP